MADLSYFDEIITSLKQTFGLAATAVQVAPKVDTAWEFAKTIIGPFVGAMLAFALNWRLHARAARRDQQAAAGLALAQIRMQWDDFCKLRSVMIRRIRQRADSLGPDAPNWAMATPTTMTFLDGNVVDMSKLGFLMSRKRGPQIFHSIALCQREDASLKALYAAHSSGVADMVRLLDGKMPARWEDAEPILGQALIATIQASQSELLQRFRLSEPVYLAAMRDLSRLVGTRSFEVPRQAGRGLRLEDLPEVPAVLETPEPLMAVRQGTSASVRNAG